MTIFEYYQIVKKKIETDDFTFKATNKKHIPEREFCYKNSHLESIHYLMFEFMSDRMDKRKKDVFDYVCIPNGVNKGDLDIDFSTWKVEEFLKEVMKLKN